MVDMNLWIAGTTKPKAKARLFCFPFGGGGTQTYRTWPQQFPAEIEVCPVRLPGREGRSNEPCFQEVIPLIQALATGLSPYLDLPFAFFGHSMGTLLAFELTRELRRRGEPLPLCLMISSGKAPHRIIPSPSSKTSPHELPDSALIEKLRYYGGTPKVTVSRTGTHGTHPSNHASRYRHRS
uniref:Thioesterase domain-containing protein n=1 Tax=Candidatus Kentrum sp. TUN TaxID=2126343 RepID=A0A450ZMM7_9GAMM|nr:MAG: Thioesterase domain-containing protein [Candidatus Kentron sp. TUN]VFK55022.1 MAG: Thioesterase domain-containing protein [Candidatus Kentron sp. TUN]